MPRNRTNKSSSALSDHAAVRGIRKGKSNQRKGARRRAALGTARKLAFVVVVIGAAAGALAGGQALRSWAKSTPLLAIESIQVSGMHRATEPALRALAGVDVADNLLSIDTDVVTEAVLAHEWVASVAVKKVYPHGLQIAVREYEPVAFVVMGRLYYVDALGTPVKQYALGEAHDLPVVTMTGLPEGASQLRDVHNRTLLSDALSLIKVWNETLGPKAPRIAEVNADAVLGMALVLHDEDARIEVGTSPWATKIKRWVAVRKTLKARGVSASLITMGGVRRPERVVARLVSKDSRAQRPSTPRANPGRIAPAVAAASPAGHGQNP